MSTQEALPYVVLAPGILQPTDVTLENPYGSYAPVVEQFRAIGLSALLIYPDWADINDPSYPVQEHWQNLIDKAVRGLIDAGHDVVLAGHSTGALEITRYAGENRDLLQRGSHIKAIMPFSPAPYSGDVLELLKHFYREGSVYPTDWVLIPEHQRAAFAEPLYRPIHTQHVPMHITVGLHERPFNHLQGWILALGGSNRTFGTMDCGHALTLEPAYQEAMPRIIMSAIKGTLLDERGGPPPLLRLDFGTRTTLAADGWALPYDQAR
ncbi:MAG TPA: hypothetical protein VLF40_06330 [Candidatus Saccharimonadales bacterium]|nr:hypothetical protein [Candidatus Saccharimonadales bacterium]